MKQINSFLSGLKSAYSQQGQVGRILLPAALLAAFCCLCSVPVALARLRNAPDVTSSPVAFPTLGTLATPTPLFNFDFPTFTPFPTWTAFVPTTFPTLTQVPTGSPTATATPGIPTSTATLVPTNTATPIPPTPTSASVPSVQIISVNKAEEYVEIQNQAQLPVNLRGWRLVSETGNQSCDLRGTLEPSQILRIWSQRGNPGFDCRFSGRIWRDNESDPAVLYNPQGEEASRFP